MNSPKLPLIFLTCCAIFVLSCSSTTSHTRKPVTAIQMIPKKKSWSYGEQIQINFQSKLKEGSLDRIEISCDGKLLSTSKILTNTIQLNTGEIGIGKHNIKSKVILTDGNFGENFEYILITSDLKPVKYTYEIVEKYPHNIDHFTQGLEFHDNVLYESTGQEGSSAIYRINLKDGSVTKKYRLEDQYFGEGITILDNKIFELTYKNKIGFIYDLKTFELLGTWNYKSAEGWGLTNNGQQIIMSDGTENIYYINKNTFQEERRIQVCDEHNLIKNINELEYINGEIWANIWTTDTIVIIDEKTGKVKGEINLSGLSGTIMKSQRESIDVLNGIAINPANGKIYVTGKLWPYLYEIKLIKVN